MNQARINQIKSNAQEFDKLYCQTPVAIKSPAKQYIETSLKQENERSKARAIILDGSKYNNNYSH